MIGKISLDIVKLIKQYNESSEVSKEDICHSIHQIVENQLNDAGFDGLNHITESGMVAVLYFLYGLGMITNKFIMAFVDDESRKGIELYNIKFTPSADAEKLYSLNIEYVKTSEDE